MKEEMEVLKPYRDDARKLARGVLEEWRLSDSSLGVRNKYIPRTLLLTPDHTRAIAQGQGLLPTNSSTSDWITLLKSAYDVDYATVLRMIKKVPTNCSMR